MTNTHSQLEMEFFKKFPSAVEVKRVDAQGRLIDEDTESQPADAQPPQGSP